MDEIPLGAGSMERAHGWAVQVPQDGGWITTYFRFAAEEHAVRFANWNYPDGGWRVIPPDDAAGFHKVGPCACGVEHRGVEAVELNRPLEGR